jgi:ribosome-associated heat shock protein Hsp15
VSLPEQQEAGLRLDKWLWAARFFKTRGLAVEAINGGKVQVDGHRVKPAKEIRPGMEVRVRIGNVEKVVRVRGLNRQRRPAQEAVLLYEETEGSRARREQQAEQRRLEQASVRARDVRRPNKRERRLIQRLKPR